MNNVRNETSGIALVTVLILLMAASASVSALIAYSSQSSLITRQAIDYQRAQMVAESGLDYGVDQLLRIMRNYHFSLSQSEMQGIVDGLPTPPEVDGYSYVTPRGYERAFRIEIETAPTQGKIEKGHYAGEYGEFQDVIVSCGAFNPKTGVGAVVQQRLQALSMYLIRFGVFYQNDLEILPGPTMVFTGRVHSNSDIYVGGPLEFRDKITAVGDLFHRRKDKDMVLGNAQIMNSHGVLHSMIESGKILDSSDPDWMTESLNRWDGHVKSAAHAISPLSPPINPLDEPHDLIERPLDKDDPDYHDLTENEKFANKAALKIHVDAAGSFSAVDYNGVDVTDRFAEAVLKDEGTYGGKPLYRKKGGGKYEFDDKGTYTLDQTFIDQREQQTMLPVDIYVDQLVEEFPELVSGMTYGEAQGRGIVYVTRDDPDGAGGVQPAVRIRNGRELPDGGLSIASDLPVYVEGNYNDKDSTKPALVTGDAVTLLSKEWQDARSASGIDARSAASTTYNTVIMTGNSETISPSAAAAGQYNGGLENVLRFLEKWSGKTVSFRGSIIDIWYSEIADSEWSYGSYYTAPDRDWGYDEMYRTASPPGIPRVFGVEEIAWRRSSWEEQGWEN